jgi:hypothetical protein
MKELMTLMTLPAFRTFFIQMALKQTDFKWIDLILIGLFNGINQITVE